MVARTQGIDEGRLPGAGARRGVDDDGVGGAENRLNGLKYAQAKLLELRAAMVNGGEVDGPQHPIGNIGWPGDLQEMPALADPIERSPRINGGMCGVRGIAFHG